jgi:hypothetical protein
MIVRDIFFGMGIDSPATFAAMRAKEDLYANIKQDIGDTEYTVVSFETKILDQEDSPYEVIIIAVIDINKIN